MLDILNEQLITSTQEPIAFDSDCREGICGTCSLTINGQAHGLVHPAAACQLYMREFQDGETITIEPFRARPFRIVKDLVIDRSSLDRIVQAGGFISARTGSTPEANSIPVPSTAPIWRWKRPPASVAARARPLAQTLLRCSSPRRRFPISRCCHKARRNALGASSGWSGKWTRKVSATALISTSAKRSARRRSAPASLPR